MKLYTLISQTVFQGTLESRDMLLIEVGDSRIGKKKESFSSHVSLEITAY